MIFIRAEDNLFDCSQAINIHALILFVKERVPGPGMLAQSSKAPLSKVKMSPSGGGENQNEATKWERRK